MRILHLCDSLNPAGLGGYESYLHYLSNEMLKLDHESFVVTQASRKDSPFKERKEGYEQFNLPGNHLESRKWEFLALPEEARDSQVSQFFANDDLERNVEALVTQMNEVLREIRPDIIHAHSTYIVFNRVLDRLSGTNVVDRIPRILTIHGLPKPIILPGNVHTTDYKQLSLHCPFDRILGVSNTVSAALRETLSHNGKDILVTRLYIGIDVDVFAPDLSQDKKWDIAFLGRLERMKGVDVFPEMLRLLIEKHPNIRMVMTGEGSLRRQLLDGFKEHSVESHVDYLGVVDSEIVPKIINQSKIFLYPSRREPFGLSVLEGMACQVPVITSNVFGPSEIVTHLHDGYTVTPGNPGVLAEAVDELLTDSELYARIRSNSRATVIDRFDLRKHIPSLLEIYASLTQ